MAEEGKELDQKHEEEMRWHHLEMIEKVIARMASNSLSIKKWSLGIISAMAAITMNTHETMSIWITVMVLIVFWGLDSYYLQLERKFRHLYDDVRIVGLVLNFSMDVSYVQEKDVEFINCLKSKTEFVFYLPLLIMLIVVG